MSDLPTLLRVRCTAGRSDERDLVCRAADEIERLELELGKTQGEVIQRQDDLGHLLHAAEAEKERQAKHIQELQAKMTRMCGSRAGNTTEARAAMQGPSETPNPLHGAISQDKRGNET